MVKQPMEEPVDKHVSKRVIQDEMKDAYMAYAMSVIVGRALPDVRDGLKPVHRRILYAMHDTGMRHNQPYKKSARIVGEVLGKYHPHGDSAVYDTLVRMVQEWSLRVPLIDGQGNFGSIDGDSAAAMRYCVSGDARVLTDTGVRKIVDLQSEKNPQILSYGKRTNTASDWFDSGEHPTLKVTTNHGFELTGSYNHPILVLSMTEEGIPAFVWKRLDEVEEGDFAVLDRSGMLWPKEEVRLNTRHAEQQLPSQVSATLGYLLGSLVAEGTLRKNKIEFCNTDEDYLAVFTQAWSEVFPDCTLHAFEREPSSYGKLPYTILETHYPAAMQVLQEAGLKFTKSRERRVPESIFNSPKPVVAQFLEAYFEGDGTMTSSGRMRELSCCSTSEKLIQDVQQLLLRFGICATKRFDKHRDVHKLYLRGGRNVKVFAKEIGFTSTRKKQALAQVVKNYQKDRSITDKIPGLSSFVRSTIPEDSEFARTFQTHNFDRYSTFETWHEELGLILLQEAGVDVRSKLAQLQELQYIFDPITSVQKDKTQSVYSIKVDSACHSFVANGFINHNTEARMAKPAQELLQDLDKETVEWADNFDGSLKEPRVLPATLPNLLVNGSAGIAVGMATNIPPHNLQEVAAAIEAYIDNPEITVQELMNFLPGPDFPTGGIICGKKGIVEAYAHGRGRIKLRGVIEREGEDRLIISEIPYQVVKADLVTQIADLVRDKRLEGIRDIRDESDRTGMRVVIELKRDANQEIVENALFKLTRLKQTFGIINLAIVDGEPKVLSLPSILKHYLDFRVEVVERRTVYDLRKAEERAHILEGLVIALKHIDDVVALTKESSSSQEAQDALIDRYDLSAEQAKAILDMKLSRLTGLEQEAIKTEHASLLEQIADFKDILDKPARVKQIIKDELAALAETYGNERRTVMGEEEEDIDLEDLIDPEEMVVTISNAGYAKRLSLDTYQAQNRGGVGIIGAKTKDDDFVEHLFVANTHAYLLFFTNKGEVYWKKVYHIPETSRTAKGTALVNLIDLDKDERISSIIAVKEFDDVRNLVFATRKGLVKKTPLEAYSRPRSGGIHAIKLDEDDDLVNVVLTTGEDELLVASDQGQSIRFHESDCRGMGRYTRGVIGMKMRADDRVVSVSVVSHGVDVLSITENGYGKRTSLEEYPLQGRGGMGVRNIKTEGRNGLVVGNKVVNEDDELLFITQKGIIIRTRAADISQIGRNTQGVRVMKLRDDDVVQAVARVVVEQSK